MTLRHTIPITLAAVLAFALAATATATPQSPWTQLWSNQANKALHTFQTAVDQDKNNPDTWRGLLLTQLLLGQDTQLTRTLDQYGKKTKGAPCDWYLTNLIDNLCGLESRKYYEALYKFQKRLSEKDDLPVLDRRLALDARATAAYRKGDPDEGRDLAKKLGRVLDWSLLGPFDNTSGSGHHRMHLEHWNPTLRMFKGKFGQQIEWNTPELIARNGVVSLNRYFEVSEQTTGYARTVIEIDKTDRYWLSLSHWGDIEVWLDGAPLYSGERETGRNEAVHWDVSLEKGPHLIAARVSNRDQSSGIGLGVCRQDGDPADIVVRPRYRFDSSTAAALDAQRRYPRFELDLAEAAARSLHPGGDPEPVFWALQQTLVTSDIDSIVSYCERVGEAFPETAVLWLACGSIYERIGKSDDADRALERARELDPSLVLPQLDLAQENLQKKRYGAAVEACDAIIASAPDCQWALGMKMRALMSKHDLEGVEKLAAELTDRLEDYPLGYDFLAEWAEARGMSEAARAYRLEAGEVEQPFFRLSQLLTEHSNKEDYDKVEEVIDDLMAYMPDSAWLWSSLLEAQIANGEYEDAMETLDTALGSFPQNVSLLYYKALFAEGGAYSRTSFVSAEDHAARIIKQALNFAPANLPLRDKYRTLAGKTPYREYLPDPDLGKILERREAAEERPGARALVLQEWKRRLFFERDISMLDYSLVVQLLTRAGVEAWEEHRLGGSSSNRVLIDYKTIKEGGDEIDANVYGNTVYFENLEPGDIIVLRYQYTDFQGGNLKGHTWDQHQFPFADPCLESRYELIRPTNFTVHVNLHNAGALGAEVSETTEDLPDNFTLQRWELLDIDAINAESNATHVRSFLPWIDVSTVPGWQEIAQWYHDLADGQAQVDATIREQTETLCAGIDGESEIVERIYRFVSQDINYVSVPFYMSAHVPRQAKEVLETRYGDCKDKSCLMIAMLEAAGIDDARFALIDLWGSRAVEMLPSPRFNHVVVCRPDGAGGYQWFDPTIKYGTSRQIPTALAGGLALVATSDDTSLTRIVGTPIHDYPSVVESRVALSDDGGATVERVASDTQLDITARRRSELENLTPRELEEGVLENIVVRHHKAVLDTVFAEGATEIDSTLTYHFAFTAPELFKRSGSILVGEVPWAGRISAQLGRMVARPERQSPIDLQRLRRYEVEVVELLLPEGVELMEQPAGTELNFGACRYVTTYELDGRVLRARSEVEFDGDRVEPGEYAEFKRFLEAVLSDQDMPLLLRRTAG